VLDTHEPFVYIRSMRAGLLLLLLFPLFSFAQSISYSAVETDYSYKVKFRSLVTADRLNHVLGIFPNAVNYQKLADEHAAHIFGLFHSAYYMDKKGFPAEMSVGFSGTKEPEVTHVDFSEVEGDPYLWIEYEAEGRTLLHKTTAELWFGSNSTATIELPFLTNFPLIYSDNMKKYRDPKFKKCTDEHYWEPKDFSYFWDPYICPELSRPPLSTLVSFELKKVEEAPAHRVPLTQIRGDNENGPLTVLYFAHGFDEIPPSGSPDEPGQKLVRDSGYKLYKNLDKVLIKQYGFTKVTGLAGLREILGDDITHLNLIREVSLENHNQRRYFSTLVRKDRNQTYIVRSGLFPSDNDKKLVTFPTFWKEAWENGDFIYYGGHSGDGTSLSIDNMLSNIKKSQMNITDGIVFSQSKTQIAYFDACSTYDHFQDMYAGLKPQNLHMLTYGLVSLFEVAAATEESVLDLIINETQDLTWKQEIEKIEASQLRPYIEFQYSNKSVRTRKYNYYSERKIYPTSLLNVFVTGD
jgi:hypothetical protein